MKSSSTFLLILVPSAIFVVVCASSSNNGYPPPPPPPPTRGMDFYSEYTQDNPEESPPRPPPGDFGSPLPPVEQASTMSTDSSWPLTDDRSSPPQQQYYSDEPPQHPPSSTDFDARRGPPPTETTNSPGRGWGGPESYNDDNLNRRPPPSSSTSQPGGISNPINYQFKADTSRDESDREEDDRRGGPRSANARRDIVTQYMSTTGGKLKVYTTSSAIGGSLGYYLAKSVLPFGMVFMSSSSAVACLFFSFLRTPIGELMRAMSLSLLLVLQRTSRIRKRYPTWRHVPGCITGRRRNGETFPPRTNNPWRYKPRRREDVDFNMMYSIVAMAFVGSTCGGNIPLVPAWIGALSGAGVFVLGCMARSPRGDLCRTLGMRIVALLMELWEIQAQLKLIPKAAVVSGQIIDKAMILDRKHRVKDRFLSLATSSYNKVMDMTSTTGEGSDERSRRGREANNDNSDNERDRGGGRRRPDPRRGDRDDDDRDDMRRRPRRGERDSEDDPRRRPGPRRGDYDDDDRRDRPRRDDDRRRRPDDYDDDRRNRRPDGDSGRFDDRRRRGDDNGRDGDDTWKETNDEPKKKGRMGRFFGK